MLVFLIETRDKCNSRRCLANGVCEWALKAVTKISEWFMGRFVPPARETSLKEAILS